MIELVNNSIRLFEFLMMIRVPLLAIGNYRKFDSSNIRLFKHTKSKLHDSILSLCFSLCGVSNKISSIKCYSTDLFQFPDVLFIFIIHRNDCSKHIETHVDIILFSILISLNFPLRASHNNFIDITPVD